MDFKQLFGLMRQGDENAIIICEECMNVWAAAIVSYIHAYDPEVVVLGGGIMRSADIICLISISGSRIELGLLSTGCILCFPN